ncbi:Erythromycin esterase [Balamuthia mandrillaris]
MKSFHTVKVEELKKYLLPLRLSNASEDARRSAYDPLFAAIGDCPVVMIGEASHGTKEFYHERAELTKRLIQEKGFRSVVVEADWPDAYRANKWCAALGGEEPSGRRGSKDKTVEESLRGFARFPSWMWRNTEMVDFLEWLREHNAAVEDPLDKVGFYGMDMYSLVTSAHEVLQFLDKTDSKAALEARNLYSCFMQYGEDTRSYGRAAAAGLSKGCRQNCLKVLMDLKSKSDEYLSRDGFAAEDELFYATTNAEVVKGAESYYRNMMKGGPNSWNLRDSHMVNTILNLHKHRSRHNCQSKLIVWAHNSHLGDARATSMGQQRGKHNVGQLLRERLGMENTFNIGLTTNTGTVTAASSWNGPWKMKKVNPGRADSYEGLFHCIAEETKEPNFMFVFNEVVPPSGEPGQSALMSCCVQGKHRRKQAICRELNQYLGVPMLERYIGVIYRPESELASHYARSILSAQYDAVIHLDETSALPPLDSESHHPSWEEENIPETYPIGE